MHRPGRGGPRAESSTLPWFDGSLHKGRGDAGHAIHSPQAHRNNLIAYLNRDHAVKEFGWKEAESGVRIGFEGAKDFCDYNLFFGCLNREYGPHDQVAEPRFVDPAHHDYRLAAGSPGIDAGRTLPDVASDLRGVRRPQGAAYDIGAYEFAPEGTLP